MLRFLGLNAFIVFHSVVFILWGLGLSLFDRDGRRVHAYAAVPWAKVILRASGVSVTLRAEKDLDRTRPYIYMTNHQSYFDILALLACLPTDFKFIMKEELMRIPLLGLAMRQVGYIGIDRTDPRKAVRGMNRAVERIRKGSSVVLFPEGTRSVDGRLQAFKRGGFNLAIRAGCDIVPVAISNSYRIVPKGSLRINRGRFLLHIGTPISTMPYNRRNVNELMQKVREAIESQMEAVEERGN